MTRTSPRARAAALVERLKARAAGWLDRSPPGWPDDPFLSGPYAPVPESPAWAPAQVDGALPPTLRGTYLRNGPNPAHPPRGRYHWFDGDGLVHAVRVRDDGVEGVDYASRFVRTVAFEDEAAAGRALWGGLLDPPWISRPPKGRGRSKNPANTALLHHHDRLLALFEGGVPYELSATDLSTVGRYLFEGDLKHVFCAHPKVHPDGHLHAFGVALRPRPPFLYYSVFGADGRLRDTHPIELPGPVMMHDFAITERFAIFMDLPQRFQLWRLFLGRSPFFFDAGRPARFGVVGRLDGRVRRWFEDDPCFVFHVVGAWEEGETVVLQACRYPRFPGGLSIGDGSGPDDAHLVEWRFDLQTGRSQRRRLADPAVEFPRIDPRETASAPSAAYFMAGDRRSIVRYDPGSEQVTHHPAPAGARFDEPCVVPADEGTWIVALAIREDRGPSELCVIDPAGFTDAPVARLRLPKHVPHGLHGLWIPS